MTRRELTFELDRVKNAVVIGAGHGIGLGIVSCLADWLPEVNVFATYRQSQYASGLIKLAENQRNKIKVARLDPCNEDAVKNFSHTVLQQTPSIELLVNAVGFLHDDAQQPEKGLESVEVSNLIRYFTVNAAVTPVLAKYFLTGFQHNTPSCFVAISARVGSITDNNSGGWYGYRASKAALNMFIRNISLEFSRRRCLCNVLAVHPGTTKTKLSQPFIARTNYKLHTPRETAENILTVINHKDLESSGYFYSWENMIIPW